MKKFSVTIPVHATATITVEAEDKQNAIIDAHNEGVPSLCHYCARELEVNDFIDNDKFIDVTEIEE